MIAIQVYVFDDLPALETQQELGRLTMTEGVWFTRASARVLSSSKVYGDPEEHPQRETYWGHVNPIGPRACYDEGKRVAETMMYAYEKQVHPSYAPPR